MFSVQLKVLHWIKIRYVMSKAKLFMYLMAFLIIFDFFSNYLWNSTSHGRKRKVCNFNFIIKVFTLRLLDVLILTPLIRLSNDVDIQLICLVSKYIWVTSSCCFYNFDTIISLYRLTY